MHHYFNPHFLTNLECPIPLLRHSSPPQLPGGTGQCVSSSLMTKLIASTASNCRAHGFKESKGQPCRFYVITIKMPVLNIMKPTTLEAHPAHGQSGHCSVMRRSSLCWCHLPNPWAPQRQCNASHRIPNLCTPDCITYPHYALMPLPGETL